MIFLASWRGTRASHLKRVRQQIHRNDLVEWELPLYSGSRYLFQATRDRGGIGRRAGFRILYGNV